MDFAKSLVVLWTCCFVGLQHASEASSRQPLTQLAEAINMFSTRLYLNLAKGSRGNIFFSPISIETALALAHLGARNATYKQMKSALQLEDFSDGKIHESFTELIGKLKSPNKDNYQFSLANKIFLKDGYNLKSEFSHQAKKYFETAVQQLDMSKDTAVKTVNDWVDKKTGGKIQNLVKEIDPMTVMLLVNAIYFNGKWKKPFENNMTKQAEFHVSEGESLQVDMMFQNRRFRTAYSEELDAQAIELEYAGDNLSLVVILPNKPHGLSAVEQKLTTENLQALLNCPVEQEVMLFLPKFKMEYSADLEESLIQLGMSDAFTRGMADFSGIDGSHNIYMSKVIHKAAIEVSEAGTEAAAATGSHMTMMSLPLTFEANHPFLFAIKDNKSGAIVFFGRVEKP